MRRFFAGSGRFESLGPGTKDHIFLLSVKAYEQILRGHGLNLHGQTLGRVEYRKTAYVPLTVDRQKVMEKVIKKNDYYSLKSKTNVAIWTILVNIFHITQFIINRWNSVSFFDNVDNFQLKGEVDSALLDQFDQLMQLVEEGRELGLSQANLNCHIK